MAAREAQIGNTNEASLPTHEEDSARRVNFDEILAAELRALTKDQDPLLKPIERAYRANTYALALSGGGIRSATFNLGIIQALAVRNLLGRFDYLSTVSGGGYIGTWLSALICRIAGGNVTRLEQALALTVGGTRPRTLLQSADPVVSKTTAAVFFLRRYGNYLTPHKRLLSGDSLAALGTYLRNLVVNQAVLLLFFSAGMALPYAAAWIVECLGPNPLRAAIFGWALLAAGCSITGPCVWARPRVVPNDDHPVWWTRQREFVAAGLALIVVALWLLAIAQFGAAAVAQEGEWILGGWLDTASFGPMATTIVWYAATYAGAWVVGNIAAMVVGAITLRSSRGGTANLYDPPINWPGGRNASVVVALAIVAGISGGVLWFAVARALQALVSRPQWGPFIPWLVNGLLFPCLLLVQWATLTLHTALASELFLENRREWWARVSGTVIALAIAWSIAVALTVIAAPIVDWGTWSLAAISLTWVGTTITGILLGKSSLTKAHSAGPSLLQTLSKFAPPIFIAGLAFFLAVAVHAAYARLTVLAIDSDNAQFAACEARSSLPVIPVEPGASMTGAQDAFVSFAVRETCRVEQLIVNGPAVILGFAALLLALGTVLGLRASINLFSLTNFYGNRLTRCYVGASTPDRRPNPYTGFDTRDRVPFAQLAAAHDGALQRPLHIVNTALNLVSGHELAWQERKAASFTFTPLHSGFSLPATAEVSSVQAYWPTAKYMGDEGPSMGTLLAISGAAASPNMGYHSSPAMSFLLTLFNVRLGRWCPNPFTDDPDILRRSGPRVGWWYLMKELFGMTDERSSYVYLSDGGHFDNLGLYELVRRRCRCIIVSDASCDPSYTFEDLGNAIRKCRVDLGVEVAVDVAKIRPDSTTSFSEQSIAVGTVKYPDAPEDAPPATLIYIKASLLQSAPIDLREFKSIHSDFPHHTTADQFFDEATFESYRSLGYWIGLQIPSLCESDVSATA